MRHCEKSSSFVCQSVIAMDIVVMHVWMSISWLLKYSLAKAGEPTGEPRRRLVISTSFSLVEYLEIALEIEVVSVGLMWWRSGIGEWHEVEVRIRVFIGFTKHPSGAPMVANRSHRNCRSLSGT